MADLSQFLNEIIEDRNTLITLLKGSGVPIEEGGLNDKVLEAFNTAILEAFSTATTPIAITDRLPSPSEMTKDGLVWVNNKCTGYDSAPEDRAIWTLSRIHEEECTHWLPHHAIPYVMTADKTKDYPVEYLGDGLYASFDGQQIAISPGDHRNEPVAYLDVTVLKALNLFANRVGL